MQTILKGKHHLKSLACPEFHFPAIRFINYLFKHALLCKWSDDYLRRLLIAL